MAKPKNSLVAQAYYLIRARDVELAEDFLHRIPRDTASVRELNAFFHQILAQYQVDTFQIRLKLVDTNDFGVWANGFISGILPFLMQNRFPSNTTKRVSSYYHDLTTLAQGHLRVVGAN